MFASRLFCIYKFGKANMLKVGLTGGVGCGKSTATKRFAALNVPIVDADRIAREVVEPGEPSLQAVVDLLGDEVLTAAGTLNRLWLRERIFSDVNARRQLEVILHPAIHKRILNTMREVEQSVDSAGYVIVDVPLLVEQHYQSLFDRIVVVDCLPEQQLARVQARDGSDTEQITSIIAAQASRTERLQAATDVLDNTQSKAWLLTQVDKLHKTFKDLSAVQP